MSELNNSNTNSVLDSGPSNLLAALERFFSVASFYPMGHSQTQKALLEFHQTIDPVVGVNEGIVVEPKDQGIVLQGIFLDDSHKGAKSLFNLLDTLGIARLEFPRNAPLEDLHTTVRNLNLLKLSADSAQEFNTMDFSTIPSTMVVVQREFGWGRFSLGNKGQMPKELTKKLDDLSDHIDSLAWSDARKEEFKLRAESFLVKTIERMDQDPGSNFVQSTQSQRKLEDVLMLGTTAIDRTIKNLAQQDDSTSIDQLFEQAAQSLNYAEDKQSVELMLDVLNEAQEITTETDPATEDQSTDESLQIDDTVYTESITELKGKVLQATARADELAIGKQDHSIEMMHICLNLVQKSSGGISENTNSPLRTRLKKHLSPPFEAQQTLAIETMIFDLVQTGDRKPIDSLMPLLLTPLLRNNSPQFIQFLERLLPDHHPEKLALLWPHLVSLLLSPKQPQSQEVVGYLQASIAKLPEESRHTESHRLDLLPVLQTGKLSMCLFQSALQPNHAVVLSLLESRQNILVGKLLNECWRKNPPSSLVAVLLRILGPYDKSHRSYYAGLLNEARTGKLSDSLKQQFSSLISSLIPQINDVLKKEPWVCQAIEIMGQLQCPESRKALEFVLTQKKFLVFNSWPEGCRQTAQKALSELPATQKGENR